MNKEKGSLLFLSMLIMSIVLTTGIGLSILLARQIKETAVIENALVAFYIAETAMDEISVEEVEKNVWIEIDFEESGEDLAYKVIEENGDLVVIVKMGISHYAFDFIEKEPGEDPGEDPSEPEEDTMIAYYNNPNSWGQVTMRYQAQHNNDTLAIYVDTMDESEYSDWFENKIDTEDIKKIRTYFCEGPAEENQTCQTDGMYPDNTRWNAGHWNTTASSVMVCVESGTEKPCNTPTTFFVYYDNPNNWDQVTMRYQVNSTGGSIFVETMTASTAYPGWFEHEVSTAEITKLRTYFCEGPAEENQTCQTDGMYPGGSSFWEVSNTRMVCVENGSSKSCYLPGIDF